MKKYRIMIAIDNKVVKTHFRWELKEALRVFNHYKVVAVNKGLKMFIALWEHGWLIREQAINY